MDRPQAAAARRTAVPKEHETRELDQQRRPSEDPQPADHQARGARQSLGEVPRDRADGLLQGPGGQPVRHPRLQLSHAHGRASSACSISSTTASTARSPVPAVAARSAQVPRRQPLHRPPQGRQGDTELDDAVLVAEGTARRPGRRRRRAGLPLHGRLARHGGRRGRHHRHAARGREAARPSSCLPPRAARACRKASSR